MVLALIVMSSLAALGSLTALSVQGSLKTSSNDRFQAVAMYAAESGGALTMSWLRANLDLVNGWGAQVRPNNNNPISPGFPANGALPGDPNNPFSADQHCWFEVIILNNRSDTGYGTGQDNDWRVVIRATGHGPQGSTSIIEWEVQATNWTTSLELVGWHVVL